MPPADTTAHTNTASKDDLAQGYIYPDGSQRDPAMDQHKKPITSSDGFKDGDHVRVTRIISGRRWVFTGVLTEVNKFTFHLYRDDTGKKKGYYAWDLEGSGEQYIELIEAGADQRQAGRQADHE